MGYQEQAPRREAQMRRVALGLMLPALRDCIAEWQREVSLELGTTDLNRVRAHAAQFCLWSIFHAL